MSCEFQIADGIKCNLETPFRFCTDHEKRQCALCPFPALKNCLKCEQIVCDQCLCCIGGNRVKKRVSIDIETHTPGFINKPEIAIEVEGGAFRKYGVFNTDELPDRTTGIFMLDMALGLKDNNPDRGIPERQVIEYGGYQDGLHYFNQYQRRQGDLGDILRREMDRRILSNYE